MSGFRQFILRGNVVDLAIAVVIGAAFGGVVTALVKDLITPLIAAIGGKPDFSGLYFTVNNSRFLYGDFINTLIAFLLIALVVYYLVVLPMNALLTRYRPERAPEAKTQQCPECLSDIPIGARRCSFCTSVISAA
ncbi:MAG: large conductance mechanosensitive channel protein MscL [Chloroflexi bacterium]|nr:large conductance mechanosensitive channel protein MscL [Chloroflexota bacterium]